MLQRRNVWLSRSNFQVLRSEICGPQEQRFIVCEKDRALRCCFCTGIQTGDELARGLSKYAQEQQLSAASLKAVGALSSVRLGWFSWLTRQRTPGGRTVSPHIGR